MQYKYIDKMDQTTKGKDFSILGYNITKQLYKTLRLSLYIGIIFATSMTAAVFVQKMYPFIHYRYKVPYKRNDSTSQEYFSDLFAIPLFNSFFGLVYGFFKYDIARYNMGYETEVQIPLKRVLVLSSLDVSIHLLINWIIVLTSFTALNMFNCCNLLSVVLIAIFCSKLSANEDMKVEKSQIIVAAIITFGILIFNFAGSNAMSGANNPLTFWPFVLVLIMLAFQGYKPEVQAQIKQQFRPPSSLLYYEVARYNFFIILIISAFSLNLWKTGIFIWEHDALSFDLMVVSLCSGLCDIVCYRIIIGHKQHILTFVITIRKIFTSIFNIMYFHHQVKNLQYVGLGIVFVGIGLSLFIEYQKIAMKNRAQKFNELQEIQDTI